MDNPNLLHSFDELVRPLIGMRVSRASNGYGSSILLSLGELHEEADASSRLFLCGEAAIVIDWEWRAEFEAGVVAGSSSSRTCIKHFLERLEGKRIDSASVYDTGPELRIQFSNGGVIRSLVMHKDDPQWYVRLPSGQTLKVINGVLTDQESNLGMPADEEAERDLSKSASQRWKSDQNVSTRDAEWCACCCFYGGLDASFYFHDFGVCACVNSPRDGRVTAARWTCPGFTPKHSDDESE